MKIFYLFFPNKVNPASITDWITGKQEVSVLVFTQATAFSAVLRATNIYSPKEPFPF